MKKNLQGLFGLVFTEREELKREAENNAGVIDRLGKLMNKIDSAAAKALKVHKALNMPIRFLIGLVTDSNPGAASEAQAEEPPTMEA